MPFFIQSYQNLFFSKVRLSRFWKKRSTKLLSQLVRQVLVFCAFSTGLYGQNIYGIVIQADENFERVSINTSENSTLNGILSQYDVISYEQAYLMAVTQKAKNCFRIKLNSGNNTP
jgi:hypothetical protein